MLKRTVDELNDRFTNKELCIFNDKKRQFSYGYLFKKCSDKATYIEGLVLAHRNVLLDADKIREQMLSSHGDVFFHVRDDNRLAKDQCRNLASLAVALPTSVNQYIKGKYTKGWTQYVVLA